MLEIPFQMAGNRYLKAGNRLVGHNFVSIDDMSILRRIGNFSFFCEKNGKANPLVLFSMKKKNDSKNFENLHEASMMNSKHLLNSNYPSNFFETYFFKGF